VLACPHTSGKPSPRDLLLDGLAIRVTQGYAAAAPMLKEALRAFRRDEELAPDDASWVYVTYRVASDLWDDDAHRERGGHQTRSWSVTTSSSGDPTPRHANHAMRTCRMMIATAKIT